jgi:hypothetical protein
MDPTTLATIFLLASGSSYLALQAEYDSATRAIFAVGGAMSWLIWSFSVRAVYIPEQAVRLENRGAFFLGFGFGVVMLLLFGQLAMQVVTEDSTDADTMQP